MDTIISVIISVIGTAILALIAWHFAKKTYYAQVENQIFLNRNIEIFTTRDKMLEPLHAMYTNAKSGEIIWGQSVSGNIIGDVTNKVVDAAKRGVKFEMIFSEESLKETSPKKEVLELFQLLNTHATVRIRNDNNIRIQGLSTKEVLIALPENTKYVAILIKDEAIVKVFREWFLSRLDDHEEKKSCDSM